VDRHTLLACKLFSMCGFRIITIWPLTLLKHGYHIHGIEHSVHVKGGNASPDIILTNTATGHALVIDCKSGANIDKGQDRRYGQITVNGLHKAGVPAAVRSHTPIYAINEEHVGRIRGHTDHALLRTGGSSGAPWSAASPGRRRGGCGGSVRARGAP